MSLITGPPPALGRIRSWVTAAASVGKNPWVKALTYLIGTAAYLE